MKILLISANRLKEPYPVYPIGLDYLAGSISGRHDIAIIDMNDFSDEESFKEALKNQGADIIGISLRNIDNTDTRDTISFIEQYRTIIKELRKKITAPIVLGGSGFTIFPDELMSALDADYGVIGEGERFGLLIDLLEKKIYPSGRPGIITRNSPAAIPAPWDGNFKRRFRSENTNVHFYLKRGGMLNLQTKRGCSFRCVYCTYPHIEGSRLRLISPDETAETARELQDAGAKYLFITDSAFNCSYTHSTEVAKSFKRAGISIPWGAFFAPTAPPDDYYAILADAGLTHAEFGTESLSNGILANYGKPFTADDVMLSHERASGAGLHIAHYLLFGGPGETEATVFETLRSADKLAKTVFFVYCGMRIYPHTRLHEIARDEGQLNGIPDLLMPVFYNSLSITGKRIIEIVEDHSRDKPNWVIGSGGKKTARLLKRMYEHGHTGPLWEHLIQ